jgi:hypothetical protein
MTIFAGFDSFAYPGDTIMQALWSNTNLYWCGFYLGPKFNWSPNYAKIKKIGWGVAPVYTGKQPGNSAKLLAIERQHRGDKVGLRQALYENGKVDGDEAVAQATAAGIRPPYVLYFDVENTVADANWLTYYRGWSRALANKLFSPGLYTRREHASYVFSHLMSDPNAGLDVILPYVWIAYYKKANANGGVIAEKDFLQTPYPEPDPSDIWKGATAWQHIGNFGAKCTEVINGREKHHRYSPVDYNSSIYRDPGQGVLSAIEFGSLSV